CSVIYFLIASTLDLCPTLYCGMGRIILVTLVNSGSPSRSMILSRSLLARLTISSSLFSWTITSPGRPTYARICAFPDGVECFHFLLVHVHAVMAVSILRDTTKPVPSISFFT